MKRISLFVCLFVLLFSFSCAPDHTTRVLFIGNSYTASGDMPTMFLELAKAGGHPVEVGMSKQGGWDLSDHLKANKTINALKSKKWNYVVLQEQTRIPSVEELRTEKMYPAVREFNRLIRERGATPLFFVTWARQDGWPEAGMVNYESMQDQIDEGYMKIAQELNAPVAPVGAAWRMVVNEHPDMKLWQEDGSQPTKRGSYLAACVFYAVIFGESPVGLPYYAELPEEDVRILQTAAAAAVLKE
jgi:hypothetical protein